MPLHRMPPVNAREEHGHSLPNMFLGETSSDFKADKNVEITCATVDQAVNSEINELSYDDIIAIQCIC